MKKFFLLFFLTVLPPVLVAQSFQSFLSRVNTAPDSQRTAIVDSFMTVHPQLPFVENDTTVHFIYRGNVSSVTVAGDPNGWSATSFPMAKLSTTNFWYLTKKYEADARLDYKYVTNGSNWIADPKNSLRAPGGFGNSELRMPRYVSPPEIVYYANIPHGTVRDTSLYSINLGSSRSMKIYLPPNYDSSSDSFRVLLVHDGLEYVSYAYATRALDYLLAHNRIKPLIAVFVPPGNRTAEYRTSQINQFSAFIVNELFPYLDARYRTIKHPSGRAVLGASDGGNISLHLAVNYPEVFGNVAAQSSNIVSAISSKFQNGPKLDMKLYLDLGTYDISELLPLVRNFIPILQSKGYEYSYAEYHEGHSWGNWRARIDNALEFFFPGQALSAEENAEVPSECLLFQNYPNPFNPTTTIRYSVSVQSLVTLKVYDLLGREVATLVHDVQQPGMKSETWSADTLPSGVYYYNLTVNELKQGSESNLFFSSQKKMVLVK